MARVSMGAPSARGNATASDLLTGKDATVIRNRHIAGEIEVQEIDEITPGSQAKIYPEAFYKDGFTVKATSAAPPDDSIGLTATSTDIVAPKTAKVNGAIVTGTIPTRASGTIVANGTLPAGYYPQPIPVQVPDPSTQGNATKYDIIVGKKAAVNGTLLTGALPVEFGGIVPANGAAQWGDGGLAVYIPQDRVYTNAAEIKVQQSQLKYAEPELDPSNIKSGVNLFGVVGQYVRPAEPNLTPANIRSGVSVYGVVGTLVPRPFFERVIADWNGSMDIDFGFVPKLISIAIKQNGQNYPVGGTMLADPSGFVYGMSQYDASNNPHIYFPAAFAQVMRFSVYKFGSSTRILAYG